MAHKVVYERSGDPAEVVRVVEGDERPAPGRGQVLVRITAFSIHPGDLVGIAGPFAGTNGEAVVPGAEATGTVEEIGPDTQVGTGVCVGARVTAFLVAGAWRGWVLASADQIVAVPDGVSEGAAAQFMINPITAVILRRAAERTVGVGYNGIAVQTAARSTVARLLAVQLARDAGSLVNLVRTDAGAGRLKERFHEIPVVVTSHRNWQNEVLSIAVGRPITATLDAVAGEHARDLLDLLAPEGSFDHLRGPRERTNAYPRQFAPTQWAANRSGEHRPLVRRQLPAASRMGCCNRASASD